MPCCRTAEIDPARFRPALRDAVRFSSTNVAAAGNAEVLLGRLPRGMTAILIALAAVAALFFMFCGLAVAALASAYRREAALQRDFEPDRPVAANRIRTDGPAARAPASQPQPAH